ncbi:unnamed protein product [Prunus armeniaca]|uniref:Uncharacterized protein n=1 Tax=Prunus armeniaca TaxID=36596 RepID=A0A6J5VAG1_PRUAR|nr:unnamed protein product [Prunus armeniaca]
MRIARKRKIRTRRVYIFLVKSTVTTTSRMLSPKVCTVEFQGRVHYMGSCAHNRRGDLRRDADDVNCRVFMQVVVVLCNE